MKSKKIFMYIGIILALIFVIVLGWLVFKNKSTETNELNEIIPEEEISNEQLRQTIITLYFMDKETADLAPEARQIDAKMLLENPYQVLINLLIEGPKNDQLLKLIPENTKLNNVEIKDEIVYIDFSEDFVKEQKLGKEQESLIINSILKTLVELSEVNGIKILIDGQENRAFPDNEVNFNNIFFIK